MTTEIITLIISMATLMVAVIIGIMQVKAARKDEKIDRLEKKLSL